MNDNTMHQLHNEKSETLVRRLHLAMLRLRSGTGHISQAIQADAGSAIVRTDAAQGVVEPGSDIASNKEDESSGHRQHTGGCIAIKNIAKLSVCEGGGVTK